MKYITNFFGVGCVALLAMLVLAPGAFAQQFSPPDPPTDLEAVATDATAGTITLTWSPVADANNGGLPLLTGNAGYKLEVSEDPAAAAPVWTVVDIAGATVGDRTQTPVTKFSFNHDLTSLTPNHNLTRHYRISAINGEGEGVPSGVVSATTHNVPDPPTDLAAVATPDAAGSISVDWSPVDEANNGGMAITSYVLETTTTPADDASWTSQAATAPNPPTTTKYSFVHTGLGAGTTHHYRVRAVNDASTDGGDNAMASATTHDVPSLPTGLTAAVTANATTVTSSDIALSWTAPASTGGLAITNYQVEVSTDDGLNFTVLQPAGGAVTDVTYTREEQTEQDPVVTQIYRIRAENAAGLGEPSDLLGVKLASPSAPTEFKAVAVDGQESIDVRWMPPVNDGEPPVTGYRIQMSELYDKDNPTVDPGDWDDLTPSPDASRRVYRHSGLTAGTTYHYRIRALNGVSDDDIDGPGGPTTGVVSVISSNKADAPTDLTATVAADMGKIVLAWNGPAEDGGSPIKAYKIEVDDGTGWASLSEAEPAEDLATDPTDPSKVKEFEYDHEDLPSGGASYTYRVSAVNDAGPGDPSETATASTDAVVPAAINDLAATRADDAASISLAWTAPANGGSDITSYKIEVSEDYDDTVDPPTATWADLDIPITEPDPTANPPTTMFSAVHTDLDPGTEYHYQVSAINSVGTGAASNVANAMTHDVPAAIADLAATAADAATSIDLAWTAPADGGSDITGYKIEVSEDYDDTVDPPTATWADLDIPITEPDPTANPPTTMFSAVHTDLDPGTEYHYQVSAMNGIGTGAASNVANATTSVAVPDAITDLTATAATASIDLAWTAPNDRGLAITGYKIEVSDDAEATWTELEASHLDVTYSHTGLDPGATRHYRVSAINSVGTGAASNVANATTHNMPAAIADLTATAAAASIDLAWTAPANGGSDITGYTIEVSEDYADADPTAATWAPLDIPITEPNPTANPPTTMFSASHTDLDPGATRHYRVSAINSVGTGAASNVANATTHDVPAAIADLAATAADDAASINIAWTAPANRGSDITGYTIEVSEDYDAADPTAATWAPLDIPITEPDPTANPPTTMFGASHTDLDLGDTRHYRVSAINSVGTGAASNVASATISLAVPDAITDLTATAAGAGIDLAWTAPDDNGFAITGYKIEVSDDAEATWMELEADHPDVTYSHTGPISGTTYHYRVSANNIAGTGAASNVASATTVTATRYAVAAGGSSSGNCADPATPCTLEAALGAGGAGDLVLMRIRRAGETATIGDATMIDKMVTLGVYVRGGSAAAKGAVSFTGSVKLMSDGNLMTHKDAAIHFTDIEVAGTPSIDKLTIGKDVMISEDDPDNTMTSVLAVDELTVNSGQTLTIGEGADVRVRLTKGEEGKKMNGKLDVKGTVDGGGDLWIAHTSDERAASGFMLHEPGDYLPDEAIDPSKVKFTADDCLMVTGGGTVENDLYAVAAGNVCVDLEEIGNLVAVGSIDTDDITTDVIFRDGVTVNGDVQQWNDARVVFEMNATIEGDVTLDYGDGGVGTDFGDPNSDPGDFERVGDFGVEFAGASNTIEGDFNLESGESQALFSTGSLNHSMSTVEGNLIIENGGEIYLQWNQGSSSDNKDNPRGHNLSVEGDVFVYADAEITMEKAAKSTIEANVCSAPGLGGGNRVMLSGDVVFTEGATLTIPTVVIVDDLEVEEEGRLIATTVHVTEEGELNSDGSVQIEDALILQGDGLEGSLAAGSTLNNLTYATVDSDLEMAASMARLSVNVEAGKELRTSEAVTVTNLGLCSGTLLLMDTDIDNKKTLTVTEHLTVKDGYLDLDSNRPGSFGTDVSKPNAAATDGYILLYVTEGERTAGLEWFAPRKVAVDHKDAVIIVNEAKSLVEGIHIFKGHLHMKGEGSHLTVGTSSSVSGIDPFVMVDNGELHSNGNNVLVHGTVTVAAGDKQVGKIVTGGGELHVLGQTPKGIYANESAMATVGVGGMIDVGMGALQLGPAYTAANNGLAGSDRPDVTLTVNKTDKDAGTVTGKIFVPAGSKETRINGEAFDIVVLDGTGNPKKNEKGADNWGGGLYFHNTKVVIDSLAAMNDGAVEFYDNLGKADDSFTIEIKKDVELNSARVYVNQKNSLKFGGNLTFGKTGGMRVWDEASVTVMGDFMQNPGSMHPGHQDGVGLAGTNTFTVMGDFMVADDAHRFETNMNTSMVLKGDFHFGTVKMGSDKTLNADLEFSGKEAQTVGSAVDLGDVLVNNSAGLVLSDSVSQGATSMLTLKSGIISSDMDNTWTVKNPGIEEDVRGRNNALTTCDDEENCAKVITGGTRRSHAAVGVSRYVMKGNSGEGEMSGGYMFPVGGMDEDRAYYRPLILQLEDDLSEAMPVTVTSTMASDDMMPSWPVDNIVVPVQGGSLTLDTHADIYWKVEFKEVPDQNPNIRIAADGLANVFDDSRLRIVQWDCEWNNPKLAGMQIARTDEGSFAENGYVNGVLNLTQEIVEVGKCAILGVAANGIENPIHLDPLTGGLARVQFIHNLPLPFPVDLFLDDVKLMSNVGFQSATGYGHYATGDHVVSVVPVVPPGVPADPIEIPLPTLVNGQTFAVIAHGSLANPSAKIVETKLRSSVENMVEAILVHGSADLGDVDVRVLDPADNMTPTKLLANNFSFNSATRYISLAPGAHNVQVTSPDNREEVEVYYLDLNGYQGETVVLNLSGGKDDLGFMGVRTNGDVFLSQVVTGVEEEGTAGIPTEFTLHGNYPNPFNPSTRIEFDLPEAAQVTLQVVDMLGREVMTLPAREFEAGANRTLELNAINMASGTYLYRMIATGAESRYVKTGRMTLVK